MHENFRSKFNVQSTEMLLLSNKVISPDGGIRGVGSSGYTSRSSSTVFITTTEEIKVLSYFLLKSLALMLPYLSSEGKTKRKSQEEANTTGL